MEKYNNAKLAKLYEEFGISIDQKVDRTVEKIINCPYVLYR